MLHGPCSRCDMANSRLGDVFVGARLLSHAVNRLEIGAHGEVGDGPDVCRHGGTEQYRLPFLLRLQPKIKKKRQSCVG